MAKSVTEIDPTQINALMKGLTLIPRATLAKNNEVLAEHYEKTNYTPLDFLDEIIRDYKDIADLAEALKADIAKLERKIYWSKTEINYSLPPDKEVYIVPTLSKALGREGIVYFLVMLRHEVTHDLQKTKMVYKPMMSYEKFVRENYIYVAGDEVLAMTASAAMDAELRSRGWNALDPGGYHQTIAALAHEPHEDFILTMQVMGYLGGEGYDTVHWPNIFRACHLSFEVDYYALDVLHVIGGTNLDNAEKLRRVERALKWTVYPNDLLDQIDRNLNFEEGWDVGEERDRRNQFLPVWTEFLSRQPKPH